MAQDFARKRNKPAAGKRKASASKKKTASRGSSATTSGSGWRWYGAGVLTGLFLSFLLYLGSLPPSGAPAPAGAEQGASAGAAEPPPRPRFDFYTLLPEQTIEVEDEPAASTAPQPRASKPQEYFLLQAGSFRQREDADRRRAELLLLGLEPTVEESNGDNGRWFRVYLGPFQSKSKMSKARSLTAAQDIDTLLLKRSG